MTKIRLKAPKDVIQFTSSNGHVYDVDEDGFVETENDEHAAEMQHNAHGFTLAPHTGSSAAALDDDGGDAFSGMTKSDLRDWLDERDVEYAPKASKDELLELARQQKA